MSESKEFAPAEMLVHVEGQSYVVAPLSLGQPTRRMRLMVRALQEFHEDIARHDRWLILGPSQPWFSTKAYLVLPILQGRYWLYAMPLPYGMAKPAISSARGRGFEGFVISQLKQVKVADAENGLSPDDLGKPLSDDEISWHLGADDPDQLVFPVFLDQVDGSENALAGYHALLRQYEETIPDSSDEEAGAS